jgi:hypothetical protein
MPIAWNLQQYLELTCQDTLATDACNQIICFLFNQSKVDKAYADTS